MNSTSSDRLWSRREPSRRWPDDLQLHPAQPLSCLSPQVPLPLCGWQEKETRAGLLFGRAFEQALGAYFHRQDATEVLFKQWTAYQNATLDYAHGDSWDRMLEQGTKLLELFAQQDRVEIRCPKRNLQIKVSRPLSATSQFIAYVSMPSAMWTELAA